MLRISMSLQLWQPSIIACYARHSVWEEIKKCSPDADIQCKHCFYGNHPNECLLVRSESVNWWHFPQHSHPPPPPQLCALAPAVGRCCEGHGPRDRVLETPLAVQSDVRSGHRAHSGLTLEDSTCQFPLQLMFILLTHIQSYRENN